MKINFLFILISIIFLLGGVDFCWAQTVLSTVEPDQFKKRFQAPQIPSSTFKKKQEQIDRTKDERDALKAATGLVINNALTLNGGSVTLNSNVIFSQTNFENPGRQNIVEISHLSGASWTEEFHI
jgi:hypothetical protein